MFFKNFPLEYFNDSVFYRRIVISCFLVLGLVNILSSQKLEIIGTIKANTVNKVIADAVILLEGTKLKSDSNQEGTFKLTTNLKGNFILKVSAEGYLTKRMPIILEEKFLMLGEIWLTKNISIDLEQNKILLTEAQLLDSEGENETFGVLSATRDIFLNRAAFDFGQLFFRGRGYDSRENLVLINGIPMNKIYNGRPEWNNWGGLNDVVRNREFSIGMQTSPYHFGGLFGTSHLETRPSSFRPGFRLSTSFSNRTYVGRIMGSFTRNTPNGFSYSFSGSKRFAKQGYIDGTSYDAFSVFGSLEYAINPKSMIWITALMAQNRKGGRAAITDEVQALMGSRYNPYWGWQEGQIRNSRERIINEPLFIFNYSNSFGRLSLNLAASYQFGYLKKSRLGYFAAPNPDPVYYRNLPSFFINSPIGASFENAYIAKEGFIKNAQIQWPRFYITNSELLGREKASYLLYNDVNDNQYIRVNNTWNYINERGLSIDLGINYQQSKSHNYAQITDLFGATYHEDIDTFSMSRNDIEGELERGEEDIFKYNYNFISKGLNFFTQVNWTLKKWNMFLAFNYKWSQNQRIGNYQNERYIGTSKGMSEILQFQTYGGKAGLTYFLNGRHWLSLDGLWLERPPTLENIFINPRENNNVVNSLNVERITGLDVNYYLRFPDLIGRITGYYTRFQDLTDINFFFVEAGVGSDFVQEVLTDQDRLHMGLELGVKYEFSSSINTSIAFALGKHVYANDPNLSINFDTLGDEEEIISTTGFKDLGKSNLKGYRLPTGPQMAFSLGLEYRDPKYWWVALKTNYFANNYINIAAINRTQSFLLNPETGLPFENITENRLATFLNQEALEDVYMLNLVGGKSWLLEGKYLSVFLSINNLLDTSFRSGGYEQSRNGNFGQFQEDNISDTPSFGPKYWYGFGRTYFLNLSISF